MATTQCPHCGAKLRMKDATVGKSGKCPMCTQVFTAKALPVGDAATPAPASPQAMPQPVVNVAPQPVAGLERSRGPIPAKVVDLDFDFRMRIAAWIGAAGLLILGLSPLFNWINFGSGGVIGIKGDGKIVLGVTVLALVALGVAFFAKGRLRMLLLASQAWASVAVFWMVGLIWRAGSVLDDPGIKDNPFAGILAALVSPGLGLYLGLIGALIAAGAMGFLAMRSLSIKGKTHLYYISQGCAAVLGILMLFLVSPTGLGRGIGATEQRTAEPQEIKWASFGDAIQQGDIEFQLTGVELGKPKIKSYSGGEVQLDDPSLVVRFRFTNRSKNKRILYTMHEGGSKVTDNFGNVYEGKSSGGVTLAGAENYANVYPGKSVDGGVCFDPPVAGFSELMIELPAREEWGGGIFHYKVPAAKVTKIN